MASILCLYTSPPTFANNALADHPAVADAMAKACAVRGLALLRPVQVRPMATFQGGYTAGVGSVTWEQEYAERWRSGWCALGVYCAEKGGEKAKETTPLNRPLGLYDPRKNTLFIRDMDSAAATATVAHEMVHALQYQNYPSLNAIQLWHNRDLAAAANSAIEGEAHIVGWHSDLERRQYLCSMDPQRATTNHVRWWGWTPTRLTAYEGFPHVFGPELALQRLLAAEEGADDSLLGSVPLSTRQVLKPNAGGAVEFIDLPTAIVGEALVNRGCRAGLANTAGALGIWGLLRQHETSGADVEEPPALIENWRGDRFLHVACPGDDNDELAWLIRWRDARAAEEFAARYQCIAKAVVAHGKVLGGAPQAATHGSVVVVTTPGLRDAVPTLLEAPTRTFASFQDWFGHGCFPQEQCGVTAANESLPPVSEDFICAKPSATPPDFTQWLETVRRARSMPPVTAADTAAVVRAAGELATFCTVNTVGNSDVAGACRAAYNGISYQTQLLQDSNWRGLAHCGNRQEVRQLLRQIHFTDAQGRQSRPLSGDYGAALAAEAFAKNGVAGLAKLANAPPLSTRQVIWPLRHLAVDFIHFPRQELKVQGCEVTVRDVRGAVAIWNLLKDRDSAEDTSPPPAMLAEWRGDRQVHLSCSANVQGWVWAIAWASTEAADWFAARYNALPSTVTKEAGLANRAEVEGRMVWMAPPALATARKLLASHLRIRSYRTFDEWRQEGCFPQNGCN